MIYMNTSLSRIYVFELIIVILALITCILLLQYSGDQPLRGVCGPGDSAVFRQASVRNP